MPAFPYVFSGSADDFSAGYAVNGSTLYAGGVFFSPTLTSVAPNAGLSFTRGAGTADSILVALNPDTAAVSWSGQFIADAASSVRLQDVASTGSAVVVVGEFTGSVDFNPFAGASFNTNSGTNTDGFIVRVAADGTAHNWTGQFTGLPNGQSLDVVMDAATNVYVLTLTEAGSFDADPFAGTDNRTVATNALVLTKLTAAGAYDYSRVVELGGAAVALQMDIGPTDDLFVVGRMVHDNATIDFDPVTAGIQSPAQASNGTDGFLVRYTSAGAYVGSWRFAGDSGEAVESVAVAADGSIYVAGTFSGTMDLDPGPGTYTAISEGASDIFFVKLNSDGTFAWGHRLGHVGAEIRPRIDTDAAGNLYVGGQLASTFDFDPSGATTAPTPIGTADQFVAKYDSTGAFAWVRTWGNAGTSQFNERLYVSGSNVWVAGNVYGTGTDIDPTAGVVTHTSAGAGDMYFQRLGTDGSYPAQPISFNLTAGSADNFIGTAGDDTVVGTASSLDLNDTLNGGAGTDVLSLTGAGPFNLNLANTFTGIERIQLPASGINQLVAKETQLAGVTSIVGGSGTDRISTTGNFTVGGRVLTSIEEIDHSGVGPTTIDAGAWVGLVSGSSAADSLVGAAGAQTIFGGTGSDTLVGGQDGDSLNGGEGSDTYVLAASDIAANDKITDTGTGGTDTIKLIGTGTFTFAGIVLLSGVETIVGDAGNADIVFAAGQLNLLSTVDGGAGTDRIVLEGGTYSLGSTTVTNIDAIIGAVVADTLALGANSVPIDGRGGNDVLNGSSGDDTVFGGADNDSITGNNGSNILLGDIGNDTIFGGALADTIWGGNDTLASGADADVIDSDTGNDFVIAGIGDDTVQRGTGSDTVLAGPGADSIGGTGDPNDDVIDGGADNDTIDGSTGADTLWGGAGADTIAGLSGADMILGEAGSDTVDGGGGNDTLWGGADADQFRYLSNADVVIADWQPGIDRIGSTNSGTYLTLIGTPQVQTNGLVYTYAGGSLTVIFQSGTPTALAAGDFVAV